MTLDLKAVEALGELEKAATQSRWVAKHKDIRAYYLHHDHRMADASTPENAALIAALRNSAPELIALAKIGLQAIEWLKADDHFWEYENECGVEHGFDEVTFDDLKSGQVKAREVLRGLVSAHQKTEG